MADNIILIGFMGVGKGRTARALAEQTSRFAVDTDDLIESMVNLKIRDI
ncbi:shikimate kinase, partial [Desulfobulbus sp. US4]|nr:shikimate kinase [Desulfobulbus sp. US4]